MKKYMYAKLAQEGWQIRLDLSLGASASRTLEALLKAIQIGIYLDKALSKLPIDEKKQAMENMVEANQSHYNVRGAISGLYMPESRKGNLTK